MKNLNIWKNTSLLDGCSEGLTFTDDKNLTDVILLGSKDINIEQFPNLKAIYRAGVGKDNVPIDECKNKGIILEFPSEETRNILFEETANYTISLILHMVYPTPSISLPWKKESRNSLKKKSALIIGTGNIGSRVEEKLKTMMTVSTYDILTNETKDLEILIRNADIVSLHIPNMPENNNFLDEKRLSWMKEGAILVNTARANLVDEESLYQEISKGKIRAAFDVFWNEPYLGKLKEFYPDSFYMSPHIASSSEDFFLGCRDDLVRMIKKIDK